MIYRMMLVSYEMERIETYDADSQSRVVPTLLSVMDD